MFIIMVLCRSEGVPHGIFDPWARWMGTWNSLDGRRRRRRRRHDLGGSLFGSFFRILKKCRKLGVSAPCGPVRLEKLALTRRVSQTVLSYEVENGKNGPKKTKWVYPWVYPWYTHGY